jgi:toxin-antitoxin system PIN domain toxin
LIAFDTNILVYAHRSDSPFHARAAELVREAAEGDEPWAMLWPCLHEFVAVVTHPRIFKNPTEIGDALAQVDDWLSSPTVVALGEVEGYWETLSRLARSGRIQGPRVHDARIAALATFHAVEELWSADRDFNRFPTLKVHNPLVR